MAEDQQSKRHDTARGKWQERPRSQSSSENTVFVGKKSPMAYVLAVVTQFTEGQNEVHLKARGRAISKAVDVAEITRNKFVPDAKVSEIKIGTEEIQANGDKLNISTMEIILRK